MFNQTVFGENLRNIKKKRSLTQESVAEKIGVSGQAVSKWEKGECLPDVYNLKLLSRLYRTSVDSLLQLDSDEDEKIVQVIRIGGAVFEIIDKPETILAGRILYAKDYDNNIDKALEANEAEKWLSSAKVVDPVLPICNICLSVNFWLDESKRAMGFVKQTTTEKQLDGVDVYKMPRSLYIRTYVDRHAAMLISKEVCEVWELFHYTRDFFMPAHGFFMADNGAQEMEVYDAGEGGPGYMYMPVKKI
ncbi:MAG: helix-turn-helix domain-containing protein [Defluviitaleaceae bacterium]|nr:helix-turn-helix domain-containing protein [Defluviitaleaceae bacterium]